MKIALSGHMFHSMKVMVFMLPYGMTGDSCTALAPITASLCPGSSLILPQQCLRHVESEPVHGKCHLLIPDLSEFILKCV